MDEKELEYLSEEELEKLIQDVEANYMLQAPANLKTEILEQAEQSVKQKTPVRLAQNRKRKLLFYRIKVSAAAAAAILLLFVLPGAGKQIPQTTQSKTLTNRLAETSGNWCEYMDQFSNLLINGPKKEIR